MRHFSLATLACAATLAGCAATVQLTSAWRSQDYAGGAFHKIVVLGVGEDGATRRSFEDSFAAVLNTRGVSAVPGYTVIPGEDTATLTQIKDAITKVGADGALVTRLLRVEQKTETTPGYVTTMPAYGFRGGFYGFYGANTRVMPPSIRTYAVASLETNLWALNGETLVWSATSRSFTPDEAATIGTGLATAVADSLKQGGLI